MSSSTVIVDADLGDATPMQIRIEQRGPDPVITEISPRVSRAAAETIDAQGGAVLPGFTDHHLHLHALAAASSSIRCGPPEVGDPIALKDALTAAHPDQSGWIRGVGYTESVAGELTAARLDALRGEVPVRIAHRSGAMWMLNTAGLAACGLDRGPGPDVPGAELDSRGRVTGRLWRADDWLRARIPHSGPPSLRAVGHRLHALGIVEMTDATPDLDSAAMVALASAIDDGHLHGRLHLLGVPLGQTVQHPRISVGPYKIVVADSGLPSLDDLTDRISRAHAADRAVAVHCVSRVAFGLLLAAWDIAGTRPGDRLEHGGVLPPSAGELLHDRGIAVVTQPGFLADRGDDFLAESDPGDRTDLYRCGTLHRAGVQVALSSDAPYGPLNPWRTVESAVLRLTASGQLVADESERLDTATALRLHQTPAADPGGPARHVAVGQPGAVLIADRPWTRLLADPGSVRTLATVL